MKKAKRILAFALCLLMVNSNVISTTAFATVSGNDVVVETTAPIETEEVCEECGGSDAHTETCSFNTISTLITETTTETTQATTEPTTTPTEADEVTGCTECGQTEGHLGTCSQYVIPADEVTDDEPEATETSLYDNLMVAENTEELYLLMLNAMENAPDQLMSLTAEEIASLRIRVNELDPEGDDADTQDILDTLDYIAGEELEGDPDMLADLTVTQDTDWSGNVTYTTGTTTWTFYNGATAYLKAPVTVKNGATLKIVGYGSLARYQDNKSFLIIVEEGGELIIEGTSEQQPLTIDGKDIIANTSLIISSGKVECEYTVIQNGKNRSVNTSGKPNGTGGGITIGQTGSLTMNHCVITKNTASLNGGGIYSTGPVTIKNSEISWNRAMSAEPGGNNKVNSGRGGGFAFTTAASISVFENVLVTQNAAMYYGGGGQISDSASLEMKGDTVFSYNTAVLHGAGALHITGDAKFTMNGGSMEYNFAQYCGGAIHSSYSCVLNMNSGKIINNTTNGRGAGIHINTGGAITLKEGILISGNKAYKEKTGTSADLDATGDNWSNVKYEGNDADFGYGGGVLIDSGTCTVDGATITNNYAEVGGGGIALTMLNMGEGGLDDYMVISFSMLSGTVSNNRTDGNGAGVYIMTNKAEENLKIEFPEDAEEKNYQWALDKITELNKHGFTGQEIIEGIPQAIVSGGTINNNTASANGGGLYLGENTEFIIRGSGDISSNEAVNGAGVYVASGAAEINGGTMKSNVATNYGGALYISGNVTMTNGTIGGDAETDANTAVNGGAMYVTNGNVTIEHGSINGNKAVGSGDLQDTANNTGRGGAVYLAGDANTILTMESGTMNKNNASNDGGAIYATGGTILIGLESCSTETAGAECTHHTDLGAGRHHPVINENKAGDTGGGIALTGGVVRFYCGKAKNNQALYKGVGKNVFMDGGKFYLYDGADVGVPRDPDLVIVGGELYNECVNKEYYNLYYYYQNTDSVTQMTGLAEYQEIMNLPDGEYFWNAPDGYVFLGWTAQGAASGNQSNEFVRNKEQYVNSGEPVEILDAKSSETDQTALNTNRLFDGTSDKTIHLYALWAPETSNITYVNGLTGATIPNTDTDPDNPTTYTFSRESNVIQIQPVKQTGYDLVGWYIYQNEEQNANWNDTQVDYENLKYEPNYTGTDYSTQKVYLKLDSHNGVLELEAGNTNFGNITLIAKFEPAYTDLKITKSGWQTIDENQTFIFKVTGTPNNTELDKIDMTVTIQGDGSVLIKDLPVGNYTVEEITDWSWRYTPVATTKSVALVDSSVMGEVDFANTRSDIYWLSGDSYCTNWWGGQNGAATKRKVSN